MHREYARFLFESTDTEEEKKGRKIIAVRYSDELRIAAALQQYEVAAKLAKNKYAFYEEIISAFEERHDYPHAFVYQYRAEELLKEDFGRILLGSNKSDTLLDKMGVKKNPAFASKEEAYRVLAESCTGNAEFGFVPCTLP